MKLQKALKHAFNMVVHSKLRSWLTILGIVIGVAAVIAIVSIGEGMEQSFNSQFDDLGGDLITLKAGYSKSGGFGPRGPGGGGSGAATEDEEVIDRTDLQALKGIPDLILINTQISGQVDATYLGRTGTVSLTGVDQKVWADITTSEVSEGRLLDSADSNVIVIGGKLAESFFEQPLGINKMITIEESSFRIVGILDDSSTSVYMPINMAYQIVDDKENDVYDSIVMKVKDEENLDETIEKVEKKLMLTRHVTEKDRDFTITSNQQTNEARQEMMSSMTLFLTAIAAVSLIVGAVGIANTMFTSVLEKTKEIGIMKAIGAKNRDILFIFIFNAALIGLVGGLLGVIFGTILSGALPALMGDVGFIRGGTIVSLESVVMALSVSIFVGILAGLVPAWQGSKLKPVDALRYE
jgi:putative ABC transport system permease protein